MSETLVPTFFLEFFFTKEKASCKAATESRETVRRESPLAVLFILQTIFSLVERGKIYQNKLGEKYPRRPFGSYNQTNQSN